MNTSEKKTEALAVLDRMKEAVIDADDDNLTISQFDGRNLALASVGVWKDLSEVEEDSGNDGS